MGRFLPGRVADASSVALLAFASTWLVASLVDRLTSSTARLEATGLIHLTGPPVTTVLFFAFYVSTIVAVVLAVASRRQRKSSVLIPTGSEPATRKKPLWKRLRALFPLSWIQWTTIFLMSVVMLGLRFVLYPWPQGADTPQYVEVANWVNLEMDFSQVLPSSRLGSGRSLTLLVVAALRAIAGAFPGNAEITTAIALPILLGLSYSVGNFLFVFLLSRDSAQGFWAALLTPTSFLTIRLTIDLFSQLLGLTLSMISLAGFFLVLTGQARVRSVAILYLLSAFTHLWTWAFFTIISGAILMWFVLTHAPPRWKTILRGSVVVGPSVLATVAVFSLFPPSAGEATAAFSLGDARPFRFVEYWYWIGGWESSVVWILAITALGVLGLGKKPDQLRVPLMLWAATTSSLVYVLGYDQSYRLIIMYPIPILAAIGLKQFRVWFSRLSKDIGPPCSSNRRLFTLGLTVLVVASVLPWTYVGQWTYFPGETAYNQLVKIRDRYGFGNQSLIIVIEQSEFDRGYLWTRAVTGSQVYPGSFLSLLRRDPYRFESHHWVVPNLAGVEEVLFPTPLYSVDSFERGHLEETSAPGIFRYRVDANFSANDFLADPSLPLARTYWEQWYVTSSVMNHSFSASEAGLHWVFYPHSGDAGVRWISYERPLPANLTESLYAMISGALVGLEGAVEIYYADQAVTSYRLDKLRTEQTLVKIAMDESNRPGKVRVIFWLEPGETSDAGWFNLDLMMVASA